MISNPIYGKVKKWQPNHQPVTVVMEGIPPLPISTNKFEERRKEQIRKRFGGLTWGYRKEFIQDQKNALDIIGDALEIHSIGSQARDKAPTKKKSGKSYHKPTACTQQQNEVSPRKDRKQNYHCLSRILPTSIFLGLL